MYVIYNTPKLRTIPNTFIFNLALADCMIALSTSTMVLITTLGKRWLLGDFVCQFTGYLNSTLGFVSIWTLVMICINRYVAVSQPLHLKQIYTRRRVVILLALVWLLGSLLAFPPLIGWNSFSSGDNLCTINTNKDQLYFVIAMLAYYLVPLPLIIFLYMRIIYLIKKHTKEMSKFDSNHEGAASDENKDAMTHVQFRNRIALVITTMNVNFSVERSDVFEHVQTTNKDEARRRTKKKDEMKKFLNESRITKMCLVVFLGFFICKTPLFIAAFTFALDYKPENFHFNTFGFMCYAMAQVINPIIYNLVNKNFRKAIANLYKNLFCCWKHKSKKEIVN